MALTKEQEDLISAMVAGGNTAKAMDMYKQYGGQLDTGAGTEQPASLQDNTVSNTQPQTVNVNKASYAPNGSPTYPTQNKVTGTGITDTTAKQGLVNTMTSAPTIPTNSTGNNNSGLVSAATGSQTTASTNPYVTIGNKNYSYDEMNDTSKQDEIRQALVDAGNAGQARTYTDGSGQTYDLTTNEPVSNTTSVTTQQDNTNTQQTTPKTYKELYPDQVSSATGVKSVNIGGQTYTADEINNPDNWDKIRQAVVNAKGDISITDNTGNTTNNITNQKALSGTTQLSSLGLTVDQNGNVTDKSGNKVGTLVNGEIQYDPTTSEGLKSQIAGLNDKLKQQSTDYLNKLNDIINTKVTPTATLTQEEALQKAAQSVNPTYDNYASKLADTMDSNAVQRGFYGQLPNEAYQRYKQSELGNERASAIATLANTMQQQSTDNALKSAEEQRAEIAQNAQNEINALNAANSSTQSNINNANTLNSIYNTESQQAAEAKSKQEQFDWTKHTYDENMAFEKAKFDFSKQMDLSEFGLKQDEQQLNKDKFDWDKQKDTATLTGYFEGNPTMAMTSLAHTMNLDDQKIALQEKQVNAEIDQNWQKIANDSAQVSIAQQRLGIEASNQSNNQALAQSKYMADIKEEAYKLTLSYYAQQNKASSAQISQMATDPSTWSNYMKSNNIDANEFNQTWQSNIDKLLQGNSGGSADISQYLK